MGFYCWKCGRKVRGQPVKHSCTRKMYGKNANHRVYDQSGNKTHRKSPASKGLICFAIRDEGVCNKKYCGYSHKLIENDLPSCYEYVYSGRCANQYKGRKKCPFSHKKHEQGIKGTRNDFQFGLSPKPVNSTSHTNSCNIKNKPVPHQLTTPELFQRKVRETLKELFLLKDLREATICFIELGQQTSSALKATLSHHIVSFGMNHGGETEQRLIGQVMAHLFTGTYQDMVTNGEVLVYPKNMLFQGLEEAMEYADDLQIDIPYVFVYLGRMLGPLLMGSDSTLLTKFLSRFTSGDTLLDECNKEVRHLYLKSTSKYIDTELVENNMSTIFVDDSL